MLLFVISNIAKFPVNFTFNIIVLCVSLSNIFTIAKPEISSTNGASTLINFYSFGFKIIFSFGKKDIDLFKKVKQHSHEFITPSISNTFLIPKTISTFLCILDTKVYTLNLWLCISTNIGITKSILTYSPFPTWILLVFEANLGRKWSDLQYK